MKSFDAAVVGCGIVGAACAASLSAAGLTVVVIEAKGIASGSTSAGMGHIVVMDDSEAQFALTRYSQQIWSDLADELPSRAEFDDCGTIWIAADDEEMDEAARKYQYLCDRGVPSEVLDEKALQMAEPHLRRGLAGGLLVPGDSTVYQLGATSFLIEKAEARGTKVFIGKRADAIDDNGVKLSDGSFIAAGSVINAAGAAAAELSPGLHISARKGHLVITERYPNFVAHQLVELGYLRSAHGDSADSVAFNVQPRKTGQIILGSSRQFGVLSGDVDREILRRMTARAFEFMPTLGELSALRVWTGFRPATPDNLPYIGRLPGHKNVYIAAGHEGLGITTSLGTGELIADAILGRTPAIPMEPYSPGRTAEGH